MRKAMMDVLHVDLANSDLAAPPSERPKFQTIRNLSQFRHTICSEES
jgi:hypothetical protein